MKIIAPFLIIVAGMLWGCIGLFVRPLNEKGLASMEIVAIRSYVTLIAMFIFLLVYDRQLFKIKGKDIWIFVGTGICSIVFFNYCYFSCISLTSLSVAAILLYTAPAFVMLGSRVLFKEHLTKRKILSLPMTFVGCILVTGGISSTTGLSIKGILVGLGAGIGYALYSIFSRYGIEKGYNSLTITFYTFLVASVGCMLIADNSMILDNVANDFNIGILFLLFGILCTVLPYLTYTAGLKYVDNGKASIIASIEPVTATLLGLLVFKEEIPATGYIGILLVLVALFICNT